MTGRRNDHRRQLHHADRGGDAGDDEVDKQERQEEDGANLEATLELGEHVGRDDNAHGCIVAPLHALGAAGGAEEFQVLVAGVAQHKVPDGFGTFVQRGFTVEHAGTVRCDGLVVDLHDDGLHEEPGHHESKSHEDLVGGCGLGAQGLTKEVEDHKQTDKRRHGENDGRQNGEQGEAGDDGPGRAVADGERFGDAALVGG